MADILKILIIDSNSVLAKQVGNKLLNHLKDVNIDYARNPMILKSRLETNYYDVIFADIQSMSDPLFVKGLLEKVESTLIIWSAVDCRHRSYDFTDYCPMGTNQRRVVLQKPINPHDTSAMLECIKDEISNLAPKL